MRNQIPLPLCTLAAALLCATAHAATVIEVQSGPDVKSVMTIEHGMARLQSEFNNYSLINPAAGQYLYVAKSSKQVVKMVDFSPSELAQKPPTPPSSAKLVHKGPGPEIAGYPTQHYQLFAGDALCQDTYLSREAMERGQLQEFHAAFYRMQMKQKRDNEAAGTTMSACDDAEQLPMARYAELGLAMRTAYPNGQIRQEVTSVKTGVAVVTGFFQPPAGLKQTSYEEYLRAMERPQNLTDDAAKRPITPKQDTAPAAAK